MTNDTQHPLAPDPRAVQLASFAGLTDDALAHLVLIGMLSTADAQTARKLRP